MQLFINDLPEVGSLEEILHNVEPIVDMLHVFQREDNPTTQHTATHRRDGTVDDVEQRFAVFLHRLKELQRADGELI